MQHNLRAQLERPTTCANLLQEIQALQQLICIQNVQRYLLFSHYQLRNLQGKTKAHGLTQSCRGI